MLRTVTNEIAGDWIATGVGILRLAETRWLSASRHLKLGDDDVHVFCATLDLFPRRMKQLAATLSSDEEIRAARFRFDRDRNRFVAARGQLREVLGEFLEVAPEQIVFSYGERGKPQLSGAINGQFLHFNLSHSDSLALIAVCRHCEVGVDIERIRPVETTGPLVTPFFSPEELRKWNSLPPSRRAEVFFDNWTRTEAFLKFNGEGIGGFPNPIFQCEGDCFIQSVRPAPDCAGAIAVENPNAKIHCWKWER